MEPPCEWRALHEYDRALDDRYGETRQMVSRAAIFLSQNQNSPEAHQQYFEALQALVACNDM